MEPNKRAKLRVFDPILDFMILHIFVLDSENVEARDLLIKIIEN